LLILLIPCLPIPPGTPALLVLLLLLLLCDRHPRPFGWPAAPAGQVLLLLLLPVRVLLLLLLLLQVPLGPPVRWQQWRLPWLGSSLLLLLLLLGLYVGLLRLLHVLLAWTVFLFLIVVIGGHVFEVFADPVPHHLLQLLDECLALLAHRGGARPLAFRDQDALVYHQQQQLWSWVRRKQQQQPQGSRMDA
jgi:hypothetical protein